MRRSLRYRTQKCKVSCAEVWVIVRTSLRYCAKILRFRTQKFVASYAKECDIVRKSLRYRAKKFAVWWAKMWNIMRNELWFRTQKFAVSCAEVCGMVRKSLRYRYRERNKNRVPISFPIPFSIGIVRRSLRCRLIP